MKLIRGATFVVLSAMASHTIAQKRRVIETACVSRYLRIAAGLSFVFGPPIGLRIGRVRSKGFFILSEMRLARAGQKGNAILFQARSMKRQSATPRLRW